MPSLTLMLIVAVPLQFVAGVSVSVEPDTLGTTFEVEEELSVLDDILVDHALGLRLGML